VYNASLALLVEEPPVFEALEPAAPDAIIGLISEYRDDPRGTKIDLGIGVYRNSDGDTPVLSSVKQAERLLVKQQTTKAYIGSAGPADFNAAMRDLAFAGSASHERIAALQTPGGSGSLRVAAGVILRARPGASIWFGAPTWANHVPLLGGAGLAMNEHPYYDPATRGLDFDGMLQALSEVPKGDILLLHACCHNPTGVDPDESQWRAIADVIVERDLLPFVDMAYQGFATDLDSDAFIVRHLAERVEEMVVCTSCSKNFGLYRDRVGALLFLTANKTTRDVVQSQANNFVRTLYSMPPDHGAAVVATILGDEQLHEEWLAELGEMRSRLQDMRTLLNDALGTAAPGHDFSHLVRANGMFSFLGISTEQVERLKKDHGIYMVGSSRINVAGITSENVAYLADSIAAVL
jgi:aspartate/tyrosine/aromatic aminotransferase